MLLLQLLFVVLGVVVLILFFIIIVRKLKVQRRCDVQSVQIVSGELQLLKIR